MRTSTAMAALLACGAAAAGRYDLGTVIDNLDRRKITKLHAQEYCRGAKGNEVTWSRGGRRSAKI